MFRFDDNHFIYSKYFGYFCGVILALLIRILAGFRFKLKITKPIAVKTRIFHIFKWRTGKEDQSLLAYIVAITKSAQCVYVSFNYCIVSFGAVKYLIKYKDLNIH